MERPWRDERVAAGVETCAGAAALVPTVCDDPGWRADWWRSSDG